MKIIGMARLGADMVVKHLPNGDPVGEVSLAFKLSRKDKATGEPATTWIKAAMFGKRAEALAPYLAKGRMHCFYLRDLIAEEYTDKDGNKRTSLKATIEDVDLADGKSEAASQEPKQQKAAIKQDYFDDDIIPF